MGKSAAFARIKADVYAIAAAVPRGRVCTYADIGQFLDVVPRQVAYLLALRDDAEREAVPWHRVVSADGSLGRPRHDFHGRSQAALLEADGVRLSPEGTVARLSQLRFRPTTANTGVVPTPRNTGARRRSDGRTAASAKRSKSPKSAASRSVRP